MEEVTLSKIVWRLFLEVRPGKANTEMVREQGYIGFGTQLRSQPILRWAIAQLTILSWVAYLKMG